MPESAASATSDRDEQRFLRYAHSKDAHGLNQLLLAHVDRCYAQARRITGRDHLADEAVQEACLKLIMTADRYDGAVPFAAWLAQLVANAAIDQLRRARRSQRHERIAGIEAAARAEAPPEDERLEMLRTALDELPERFRRPMVIHYVAGLDHEQTAKALGVASGTVASRISRGKERLRARLARLSRLPRGGAVAGVATLAELAVAPTSAAPASLGHSLAPAIAHGFAATSAAAGVAAVFAAHPLVAAALALAALTAVAVPVARALRDPPALASAMTAPQPSTVQVAIGDDLQAAIQAHPAGTHFILAAGIHRLQAAAPKDADTFTGEPGAVMSGARELVGFQGDRGHWRMDGQTQQGQVHGVCEDGWPGAAFPEDLFVDDVPLRHVRSLADLQAGAWFFDYDADRIWIADDPSGHRVETSVARCAFSGPAKDVVISGLTVEKYAIPAQMGAIGEQYAPAGWTILDCEVRLNHGTGISMGERWLVSRCRIHDNGQKGIGGSGRGLTLDHCELIGNNRAHYDTGWEAGGAKFAGVTDLALRANRVVGNRGCGLLVEGAVANARFEDNVVLDNTHEGISYICGWGGAITGNEVRRNGRAFSAWLWGAQILLRDTSEVEISGNSVEVAADGGNAICLMQQDCGSGPRGPYRTTGNDVHDNDIVFRGDLGVAGCAADFEEAAMVAGNNRFDRNRYHAVDTARARWAWSGATRSWIDLRSLGQEASGTFDSTLPP